MASESQDIRSSARDSLYGVESQRRKYAVDAESARAFSARVNTPGVAESFVTPYSKIGVSNEGTGAARMAVEEARASVHGAELALIAQRELFNEQRARSMRAEEERGDTQGRAIETRERAEKAKTADAYAWFDPSGNSMRSSVEGQQDQLRTRLALDNASKQVDIERNALANARNDLSAKENELGAKRLALAKAELEESKNKLAVLRAEQQVVRSSASSFADMTPGERQRLVRDADQLRERGYESLSRAQRQRVRQFGITSEFAENQAIESGGSDPEFQRLTQRFGVRGLKEGRIQADELEAKLTQQYAQNVADISTALERSNDRWAAEMEKLINKNTDDKIKALQEKLETAQLSQDLQRRLQ